MKKVTNIGIGKPCRKCNEPTIIRKRVVIPKNKDFYYKQWEFCKKCNAVYFDEQFKSPVWSEAENQESFFKSLK